MAESASSPPMARSQLKPVSALRMIAPMMYMAEVSMGLIVFISYAWKNLG